jgi:hypothetical protein
VCAWRGVKDCFSSIFLLLFSYSQYSTEIELLFKRVTVRNVEKEKGEGVRKGNNRGDKYDQSTLYACMGMS